MIKGCNCNAAGEKARHILELLHSLTDGLDEIAYVADIGTKEILFANKKAQEIFGKNIPGRKKHRILHDKNQPCPICVNETTHGKRHAKSRTQEFRNGRSGRWYRCLNKAIRWPGDKRVRFGIAVDITEQKNTEDALRKSEKRYQNLIETAPVVIYTLSADGNVTSLNAEFERATGWASREWVGKPFAPLIHPDDLCLAEKTFKRTLRGKTVKPYQLRVLSKSGQYLTGEFTSTPMIKDGKIVGEFGIVQDVTERKRIESTLKEREKFFRSVVESSHDAILIIDDNFRIIYANDEAARLGGYSKEKMVGRDFRKNLAKDSRAMVEKRYLRCQREQRTQSQCEFWVTRRDGEKINVEAKCTIFKDQHGNVRTIAHLREITERTEMENERKRFENSLSALNMYGQSLNMARNMEEIYKLTLDATEKTLGFEYASILIVEGKILCMTGHRGYSRSLSLKLPLDGDEGITVRVVRKARSILVRDVKRDKTYVHGGEGIRSELAVPIKAGNKILGVLNVESKKIAAFTEEDRKLLEILASHAATAMSNLNRQEKLSAINSYGRSLNKTRNTEETYKLTLNAMEKVLGFQFVDIFLVEGKKLKLAATRGLSKATAISMPMDGRKGVTVRVARTGKPIFVRDVRKEEAYIAAGTEGMRSELAVPIKSRKRILGVLNVESDRLAAFDEEDQELLEILASHFAIAIGNLRRREQFRRLTKKLEHLMRSSTKIMHITEKHQRLTVIAKAIQNFGWRRVVMSLRDENLEGTECVTVGLTKQEVELLGKRRVAGRVWRERLGPKFEKFKIGEFYYLPWTDPWIREYVHEVPHGTPLDDATTYTGVPSTLSPEEMIDWHPQDMLYAPLRTPEGRIMGIMSMDDPVDGRRPARETLAPLELFLHQAAITIENAQLIEGMREARKQLEVYTGQLEEKVEERTRELKKSQEQLLKAQRLAVIGELAGMVGHDLRNPLTSIGGAEYYIKKRLKLEANHKIREMLELIEKNISYSNKIINDLLDYSREIELELTQTNAKSLVKEAMSLVEIPKDVRVIDETENKPKIDADGEKIKRVFVNLIKNAAEAMADGGTLTISSKQVNGSLEVVFSDTGVGMSKETLSKIWTPLFTTKAKGMGFGLSICKRFIEAHGGSIYVASTRGGGTTFTITLPISHKTEEGGEKLWIKPLESSLLTMTKT
jgi:PAS domain S-box-containing protein